MTHEQINITFNVEVVEPEHVKALILAATTAVHRATERNLIGSVRAQTGYISGIDR